MSLLALNNQKKQNALNVSGTQATLDQSRQANNEAMKAQHRQGQVSGVGSAVGVGMMIGGPMGWAVGGTLALLSLF